MRALTKFHVVLPAHSDIGGVGPADPARWYHTIHLRFPKMVIISQSYAVYNSFVVSEVSAVVSEHITPKVFRLTENCFLREYIHSRHSQS